MASPTIPNAEFIERCQEEYARNPNSRVFAPLSEAYRKMGLTKEALEIARSGVRRHPDFAAGHIALARLLIGSKAHREALTELQRATELSPDNLLAFQLLGETYLELRQPKDALKAFKMVLFLNPLHERAQAMVRKWEFLTADEFESDVFDWTPTDDSVVDAAVDLSVPVAATDSNRARERRAIERAISIADALTVRNDHDNAFDILSRTVREWGSRPELQQRLKLLGKRLGRAPVSEPIATVETPPARLDGESAKKRRRLEGLLTKLSSRKHE